MLTREHDARKRGIDPVLLLSWYDRHRRRLPWRAPAGEAPDPYRVWLSEIMLQQTTVKAAGPYFERFMARFPDVRALAQAETEDVMRAWAGLGYYSRARNLHACARMVAREHDGRFPASVAALRALPGIGPYTAAAIAAIAFDEPAVPVDGNVERVESRLFRVAEPLPGAKPLIGALAAAVGPEKRHGDFAQALMDLGATICTPRSPSCLHCPWQAGCAARERGDPETFPVKPRKSPGRTRFGAAFVAVRADAMVLVRTRPPKGLLGGMTEVPTTDWHAEFRMEEATESAPLRAPWRRVGTVEHVFTHFPLRLDVYRADIPDPAPAPGDCRWMPAASVGGEAFPSVFRKVLAAAGLHPAEKSPVRRGARIRA